VFSKLVTIVRFEVAITRNAVKKGLILMIMTLYLNVTYFLL